MSEDIKKRDLLREAQIDLRNILNLTEEDIEYIRIRDGKILKGYITFAFITTLINSSIIMAPNILPREWEIFIIATLNLSFYLVHAARATEKSLQRHKTVKEILETSAIPTETTPLKAALKRLLVGDYTRIFAAKLMASSKKNPSPSETS